MTATYNQLISTQAQSETFINISNGEIYLFLPNIHIYFYDILTEIPGLHFSYIDYLQSSGISILLRAIKLLSSNLSCVLNIITPALKFIAYDYTEHSGFLATYIPNILFTNNIFFIYGIHTSIPTISIKLSGDGILNINTPLIYSLLNGLPNGIGVLYFSLHDVYFKKYNRFYITISSLKIELSGTVYNTHQSILRIILYGKYKTIINYNSLKIYTLPPFINLITRKPYLNVVFNFKFNSLIIGDIFTSIASTLQLSLPHVLFKTKKINELYIITKLIDIYLNGKSKLNILLVKPYINIEGISTIQSILKVELYNKFISNFTSEYIRSSILSFTLPLIKGFLESYYLHSFFIDIPNIHISCLSTKNLQTHFNFTLSSIKLYLNSNSNIRGTLYV